MTSDAILDRLLALHPRSIDLSLGRIERLLDALGRPQDRLPPVIHVAGTNGKGSTVAFARACLEAAGRRVHAYTSPHLVRFHERIRLAAPGGGRLVEEDLLAEALARCEDANGGAPITFFEITTAAALLLFCEHPADTVLLEVGLGGRLDATNVVARPACAIVTPIGLDHADHLGTTHAAIAREKAGVFKRGCPAVIAPQDHAEAEAVLSAAAEEARARPVLIGNQDFQAREERGRLVYEDEDGLLDLPLPRLPGRHQLVNAGAAIAGLRAGGFALPAAAFEAGIPGAAWPGRLQRLGRGRLAVLAPPGAELWLDGGHNPDGARAVASAMAELEERHPRPLVLIAGTLATKDARGVFAPFAGLAAEVLTVPVRAAAGRPAAETAALARDAGLRAEAAAGLEAALDALGGRAWPRPPRLLILGSLHLAGEALALDGSAPE